MLGENSFNHPGQVVHWMRPYPRAV